MNGGIPAGTRHESEAALATLSSFLAEISYRSIEGFPTADDQAILRLSDPPAYTAAPNPFIGQMIARSRTRRRAVRAGLGLPDDDDDAADAGNRTYTREPFAADVREGKRDPIYNAHGYHTKVPHRAIMRYILHYTDPGDIVFDGFCGSGMTGVAAQLCGDAAAVESLGYAVDGRGRIDLGEKRQGRLGQRSAVLADLSPLATLIAHNYTAPVDAADFEREASRVLDEVHAACGWMYATWHPHCGARDRVKGRISYSVWSDLFVCRTCGGEFTFRQAAVDATTETVRHRFACPHCKAGHTKRTLDRAWETVYDPALRQSVRRAKQALVLIRYTVGSRTYDKLPDAEDHGLVEAIAGVRPRGWFPVVRMPFGREGRRNDDIGLQYVHQYFTPRNLYALAEVFAAVNRAPDAIRPYLLYTFDQAVMGMSRWARYVPRHFSQVNQGLSGTLYVGSQVVEASPQYVVGGKVERLKAVLRQLDGAPPDSAVVTTQSSTSLPQIPNACIDYIFTDPPFGANLSYSELSFITEAWLQVVTNPVSEAVVSQTRGKGLLEYQRLMERCFAECERVLRPGRWITVEFHNSRNAVWRSIQEALLRAGLVVADVRTLDKQHDTFKQLTSDQAVKQDLIISAYKPHAAFERGFVLEAGTADGAWNFVREHLGQVPIVVERNGVLEPVGERQAFLLFDRMVAFHVQRGAAVPLSASSFYAGLQSKFDTEDGMFFLPDQVVEYRAAKMRAPRVEQLPVYVSDEKSALHWLHRQLDPVSLGRPQSYAEIQPEYLQEIHQATHEALPELGDLLRENFLQDAVGRWYVPEAGNAADLEARRHQGLLAEFRQYEHGRGRLKEFRTEAVRAGFADAWARREFKLIVEIGDRLPEEVLQEDPDLLMYYDNAALRS